jgi:hypothetical protein
MAGIIVSGLQFLTAKARPPAQVIDSMLII